MNREAEEFRISSDIKQANLEVLRGRLEQAEHCIREVAASLAWNCFGECRAVHDGPIMPAQGALEMARDFLASQHGEQCSQCGGSGSVSDSDGCGVWYVECPSCATKHSCKNCLGVDPESCMFKHPEQAEGAQGEREVKPNPSCSMCGGNGYFCEFSTVETCWCCLPEPESEETVEALKGKIESLKAGITNMKQQRDAAVARAALAQPSPVQTCTHPDCGRFYDHNAKRWACRAWADNACAADHAQPSPAPELERPEVVTHSDDAAVDRFSASMKQKLEAARAKGRSGWDDPSSCDVAFLAERLIEHLGKGNAGTFEDVANFAMMLHQRGAHPQVLAEAAGAIERDYLRIIQAQEEKWSGRFEVLEDEAKTLRRERDAAQARVEELERVLLPFAEVADAYDPAEDDSFQPWKDASDIDFLRLTLGQHRAAKAALGATAPVAQAGQVPDLERALAGMLFAFDDGVGQEWSADLLDFARKLVKAKEFVDAPAQGGSAHE